MDLDAIEAAEKAMTPGPLTQKHCRVSDRLDNTLAYTNHRTDAEGIVTLRNAAPDLITRIREQDAEIERLKCACSKQDDAICQTLGQALGYPRYSDDPKNFPGAVGAEVCVGDHVAESLADEAAREIKRLRELCGQAADEQDAAEGEGYGALSRDTYARLRAAEKGEQ